MENSTEDVAPIPDLLVTVSVMLKNPKDIEKTIYDEEDLILTLSDLTDVQLNGYVERIRTECNIDCQTTPPEVIWKESITQNARFDYKHVKQVNGWGQYGHVVANLEPCGSDEPYARNGLLFVNDITGGQIPKEYIPHVEIGFWMACKEGPLTGHRVTGVKMTLVWGSYHDVDSSELAFKIAATQGFCKGMLDAKLVVLGPLMQVTITAPSDSLGRITAALQERGTAVSGSEDVGDGKVTFCAAATMDSMLGFSTALKEATQGSGEYPMALLRWEPCSQEKQDELVAKYKAVQAAE